jgi:DMSO/TMAO reductase YedYZ molybdopterin-dependent catalytic subunit
LAHLDVTEMVRRRVLTWGGFLALLMATSVVHAQAPAGAEYVLRVEGAVLTPLAFTRQQIEALPWREYAESREVQQDGRVVKLSVRYQGYPLRDLIDQAGLAPERRAVRHTAVLLTARDGYRVVFSWGEIYNSALGDGVIVVRSQDGRDILAADGLLALRSLQDTRSGPRHVRWLERLELRVLGD